MTHLTQLKRDQVCTILLGGAHRVGKGTACHALSVATSYRHVILDRGFESSYAFGKVFNRQPIDLERAIHDYFANPTACLVYFQLGANDFEADREADAARKEQWVGPPKLAYANRDLDKYVNEAVTMAEQLGYASRVLRLTAREHDPSAQASIILRWLDNVFV